MVSIFRVFKLTSSFNPDINVLHCFTNFIWSFQWNIFIVVSYVAIGLLVVVGLGFLKENISIGIVPPKSGAGIVNIGGTNLNIQSQRMMPLTKPIVVQPTPLWQRRLSSHASSLTLESNGVDSSISTHTSDLIVSHDLSPLSISTGNLSSVGPLTEIGEERLDDSKSIATLVFKL